MTKDILDTSDDMFESKKKSSCRMNFKKLRKRRNKLKDGYISTYNDFNVKTALIENEIMDDDTNDELTDREIKATCKRLKFCKQGDKTDMYKVCDKNVENYYSGRDETTCSLTDLEDIMRKQETSNSLFTKKKKKLNTYKSCFPQGRNKKRKINWFRLRRKKEKDIQNDKDLKYLIDAAYSNYKDYRHMKALDNNIAQYNTTCIMTTANDIKSYTPWIF